MRTMLTATLLTLGLLIAACGDPDPSQEATTSGGEPSEAPTDDRADDDDRAGSEDASTEESGQHDASSGGDGAPPTDSDEAAGYDLTGSCDNPADGYRIAYPERWDANDGEVTAPCRVFDVQPPEIEPNTVLPLASSVLLLVEDRELETTHERIVDDPATDVEVVEETEIGGRAALRVEGVATGEAYLRGGTEVHRTYVAFDGRTLTAQASELGEPDLSTRRDVIHDMLATLEPVSGHDGPEDDRGTSVGTNSEETNGPGTNGDETKGDGANGDGDPRDRETPLIGEPTPEPHTGGEGRGELTDVRLGDHDGFVRLTLEFEEQVPAYEVAPTDGPIRAYPSDEDLGVDAAAYLEIVTEGTRLDLSDDGVVETYDGPLRLDGPADPVDEVVMSGDHHGVMTWVLGLSHDAEAAVDHLDDPSRIVVDIVDDR